ncbi:putative F-box associated interaction domain-containing protein [Helianthus anomalus]
MEPSHQLSAHSRFQFHILRSVQDSRFTLRRPESPFISLQPTNDLVLWNPTTTKYKLLSTPTGQGLHNNVNDAVGLYKGPADDYNVLHIKRTTGVTTAHIYSRRLGTWRQIPFDTKPEYATRMFIWSHGTLCGNTLYFTITEEWDVFINVVIAFNTITEKIIEIPFPPVPPTSVYEGVLANVQDSLQMLLMTTSGGTKKKADLWTLNGDRLDNLFSTPPVTRIPFSTWVTFTHFMTNGTWYFMSGPIKLYEFATENNPLDRFYAGNWNPRTMEGTSNQPQAIHPETAPAVKHNNKRKTPSVTKPSPRESDPQADSPTKHVKTTPAGTPKHIQLLQINCVYIVSIIFINKQNHISATSMNHTTNKPNTNQDAIATASEAENKRVDQEKKDRRLGR